MRPLGQVGERVEACLVQSNLKVQVGTRRTTCVSRPTNEGALIYCLTRCDIEAVQVRVECLVAVTMVDHNEIAITIRTPCRIRNRTGVRGIERRTRYQTYVDRLVTIPVVLCNAARSDGPHKRPRTRYRDHKT